MNETNQGKVTKTLARGQTLVTSLGKDSSDYAGSMADEVPAKLKMGGGINDTSRSDPKD